MRRIRQVAASIALVAMTLSLSQGMLASACLPDGGDTPMAMHGDHGATPSMPGHSAPDSGSDAADCPMGTAMTTCVATALVTARAVAVPPAPVISIERAAQPSHIPVSFVSLGLFRPPIA